MTIGTRKVTEADYKAGAEDILSVLQERFGEEVPTLLGENMKSLAENYAGEQTEDALKAFGQELTLEHFLLYKIEEDSDAYVLALISEEEEEAFGQEMKSLKRKARVLLQPRKKPGTAAKRIDLGKRLPCQTYDMPEGFRFDSQVPVDGLYLVNNLSFGGEKEVKSALISLDPKPQVVKKI